MNFSFYDTRKRWTKQYMENKIIVHQIKCYVFLPTPEFISFSMALSIWRAWVIHTFELWAYAPWIYVLDLQHVFVQRRMKFFWKVYIRQHYNVYWIIWFKLADYSCHYITCIFFLKIFQIRWMPKKICK